MPDRPPPDGPPPVDPRTPDPEPADHEPADPGAEAADLSPDDVGKAPFPLTGPESRVLAAVALGGAVGTLSRYGLALAVPVGGDGFPWSTWVINVTGSLFLGAVLTVLIERRTPTRYLRPLLGTGFAGGYTTWSTFMVDTDLLVHHHHPEVAAVYVVATLVGGLAALRLGAEALRRVPPSWLTPLPYAGAGPGGRAGRQ